MTSPELLQLALLARHLCLCINSHINPLLQSPFELLFVRLFESLVQYARQCILEATERQACSCAGEMTVVSSDTDTREQDDSMKFVKTQLCATTSILYLLQVRPIRLSASRIAQTASNGTTGVATPAVKSRLVFFLSLGTRVLIGSPGSSLWCRCLQQSRHHARQQAWKQRD